MDFGLEIIKEAEQLAQKFDETVYKVTVRLDDKAQQTGGVAGLFLAAAFGFLKPGSVSTGLGAGNHWAGGLLITIIASLIFALAMCLAVVWLRNGPMPLSPSGVMSLNNDLLGVSPEQITDDVKTSYYRDRLSMWNAILEERKAINKGKARRLQVAQSLLGLAMLLVGILLSSVVGHMLLAGKIY